MNAESRAILPHLALGPAAWHLAPLGRCPCFCLGPRLLLSRCLSWNFLLLFPDLAPGTLGPHGLAPRLPPPALGCLRASTFLLLLPSYQLAGFLLPLQALPQHHLHYHCIHSSQFTVDSWSWAFDSPKTALKILAFDPKYTGLTLLPGSTGQIRKSLGLYVPCQQSECPKFIRAAKI